VKRRVIFIEIPPDSGLLLLNAKKRDRTQHTRRTMLVQDDAQAFRLGHHVDSSPHGSCELKTANTQPRDCWMSHETKVAAARWAGTDMRRAAAALRWASCHDSIAAVTICWGW
jgi:hypothetical protein